jgi:lysyl-tRNA synthetase class II
MSHSELSEQELLRRESLQKLRDLGIDPYPAALYPVDAFAEDIKANFEDGKQVCLAGRMLSQRIMGKASFAEIQDASGRIQVYFNRDELCTGEDKTLYNEVFKKLDKDDDRLISVDEIIDVVDASHEDMNFVLNTLRKKSQEINRPIDFELFRDIVNLTPRIKGQRVQWASCLGLEIRLSPTYGQTCPAKVLLS